MVAATEPETSTATPGTKRKFPEREAFQTAPGEHAWQKKGGLVPHGAGASAYMTGKRAGATADTERGGESMGAQAGPGHTGHQGMASGCQWSLSSVGGC